jgi:hypothetical protein
MISNSQRATRFVPQLESLEVREVPAIQILNTGHTLQIIGDAQANTISILDNGQGTISVSVGTEQFTLTGINNVKIDTRAGDDTVNYKLTGPLEVTESIEAWLGKGSDTSSFNFGHGIASDGNLTLKVHDGTGADQNTVKIGAIALGGSVSVNVDGGTGVNTIDRKTPDMELGKLDVNVIG